tara:strand:+ start:67 stop:444 length:378 start_codon:yes stop_codon:yes gene_type:complete
MSSVLNVDTIADKAGTGPVGLTKQSADKAWVNFNGTSTLAVSDSFNHSSVTDNGTGHYFPNLTSAMANANYSNTAMTVDTGPGDFVCFDGGTSQTTTQIRIYIFTSSSSIVDAGLVCVDYNGDLA